MNTWILILPSILILFIGFLNLCRHTFKWFEVAATFVVAYSVSYGVYTIFIDFVYIELLFNFVNVFLIFIFIYCKLKSVPLSLFYALTGTLTVMAGGNIAG
jgi:hypothetical protein